MDNKNNLNIAIIGQNKKNSTLLEYLKSSNNMYIDTPISNSIDFYDIKSKEIFIKKLKLQTEFISKMYKLTKLNNKKHSSSLLNQKRKQYSYILNKILK